MQIRRKKRKPRIFSLSVPEFSLPCCRIFGFPRQSERKKPIFLICYKMRQILNQIRLFNTNISIYSTISMLYFILEYNVF